MEVKEFWLPCDGMRMSAVLEKPEGERCPIVVVIHGFTGYKEERHIVAVSQCLNEIGYATLRVDMYGHGHSDGRFHDHTLYKWLTNGMAAVDYACSLDFVTDVYLCGHSQGGLTVMLLAALERDRIRGIIPLSPAAMIPEAARQGNMLGMAFDPERVPEVIECRKDLTLGGNYVRVAQMIDVEAAIDRYKGPVLIVHGDGDMEVPVQVGRDAAGRYANCDFVLIPGDTHCYDYHLDQVVEAVKNWMEPRIDG